MPRERLGYRETLADIIEFSGGKRMLSVGEVKAYTGFKDERSLKSRYPFDRGYISATVLASYMSRGDVST